MFSELLDFASFKNQEEIIDFLYSIFQEDFVINRCHLADKIYIDPCSYRKTEDKERVFWHVITKDNPKTKVREFDKNRAARIKWIRKIILNCNSNHIKLFYYYEKNKKVRLYLWAESVDFIVIIQKLGKTSGYLVTSFYIDKSFNRETYQQRYEDYINKKDERLINCEWF